MNSQSTLTYSDVQKLVREYLARFARSYRISRSADIDAIHRWCCDNCGIEYKDWFIHRGGRYDEWANLHIRSERTATVFLLVWGDTLWREK